MKKIGLLIILFTYSIIGISQNDSITFSISKPLCYSNCNGSIVASVSGTNAPYSFLWSNGVTTNSIVGLCAGAYTLSVTNANSVITTSVISLTEPDPLVVNLTYCGLPCGWFSSVSTTVCINPQGGTLPYSFSVTNTSNTTIVSGIIIDNFNVTCLTPTLGAYDIIMTDSNNCQASLYGNYVILDSTNCNTTLSSPSCSTCCDGVVQLNFTNPCPTCSSTLYQAGITYTSSTNTFTNVCLGAYTITATNFGCPSTFIDTLARPAVITSITNMYNSSDFELFPNPTNGVITINHNYSVERITIINSLGVIVKKISTENTTSTIIDLSIFAKGIYLIEFVDKENRIITHKKIVLE